MLWPESTAAHQVSAFASCYTLIAICILYAAAGRARGTLRL